jgi:VWFA-related protein
MFKKLVGLFLPIILVVANLGVIHAQEPEINDVTINYLEAQPDEFGNVTISAYVSVSDENGRPITSLNQDNFVVIEDSQEVLLSKLEPAVDPISLVIVVDTSGTMASVGSDGRLAIDAAKQAIVPFISALSPDDQVAIYSFNDEVILGQDITVDHGAAINAVNSLNYKDYGHTCLYDALFQAVKKSAEAPQGRRALIVLTDGVDETGYGPCSVHTMGDVIDAATTATIKVPIFAIGFGKNINERELERMANLTGGRGLTAPDATELNVLFASIGDQLKNQYHFSYLTQAVSGEHSVVAKVKANNGTQGEDERRVFVPPSGTQPKQTFESTENPAPAIPVSEFSIAIADALANSPMEGELEIVVDVSQAEKIEKASLYVDDALEKELFEPPFDSFILKMSDFSDGKHIVRVEVTDEVGFTAIDKRDLTLSMPPPPPIADALPQSNTINDSSETTAFSFLPFAIGGALLVLVLAGVIVFVVLVSRSKPTPNYLVDDHRTEDDRLDPVKPLVTEDTLIGKLDPYRTMDVVDEFSGNDSTVPNASVPSAKLIVVKGLNVLQGDTFPIKKSKVTIGRNDETTINDINIQDKPVSRQHAEIIFDGERFAIRDCGSTYGTMVNGTPVKSSLVTLTNMAEIGIGTKTIVRFELSRKHHGSDNFRTMDSDLEDDPYRTTDIY